MTGRWVAVFLVSAALAPLVLLHGYQMRHSQQYEWEMQDPIDDPPDANEKTEYAFARLRYHSGGGRFGRGYSWGIDSNRADRDLMVGVRRLTRIHTRSVEEIIDVDNGPMFDWPWLYAVEVGNWTLSEAEAKKIRDYLDRGGFLMVDDFHGELEWQIFMQSFRRIFPDREVVDIPNDDPIFHIIYDLGDRIQIPGRQFLRSGTTWERFDGQVAHWRGVYDDRGRLQVAICHNMDLGDAWQYADDPQYPEKFTSMAYRIGVNYVVYSMTH